MKKNLKLLIIIILFVVINIKKKENFRQVLDWPSRTVLIWGGNLNDIPNGWALCNGLNGTPDLRGRFILGYNNDITSSTNSDNTTTNITKNTLNYKGGEEKVKLEIKHLPKHNHPDNINELGQGGDGAWYESGGYRLRINSNKGFTGEDQPHNNMPPYYVLAYIMKIS